MDNEISQPNAQRASWVWLLVLYTFGSLVETIFYGQLGAFTPLYLPKLGVAAGQVARWTGIIAAVAGMVGLPFLPFWGALADRYARKPIIIRSFVVHMLAGVFCALAGNIWIFLLGRAISSLALGNSGLMMTTLSERAPGNRQGLAFSIMNSAAPVGIFLGPLIGGPVVDNWGFQSLLGIDAVLMLIVILGLVFGYQDDYTPIESKPILGMALDSLHILWRSGRLRALFPALFTLFAGWMLAMTYVPLAVNALYTGKDIGTQVGFVMGVGGLLALVFSPLIGLLADRYGLWRVLFVGAVLTIFLWPLPALTSGLVAFGLTWALVNGVVSGVFSISFNVLAQSAASDVRGRVMSFAYLPVNVGATIGPALGSAITHESVFTVFPAAALLSALGLVLLYIAKKQPVN
jgi:DHA1 family multidrug resistance protein-like MFS transporter